MYIMKMLVFIFGVLIAILGAAVWGASQVWLSGEDVEIGFHGGFALILGALGSLLVGGFLMALLFLALSMVMMSKCSLLTMKSIGIERAQAP